jgi:hypothetical protein
LLTHHPVLVRCAELSWLRVPEVDHKPHGSVLYGGEPPDGSWHVDAQGPLALYADSEADPPEPREPGIYGAPQAPSPFPERNGRSLIPFMLRASVLMSDTADDMGPCRVSDGTRARRLPGCCGPHDGLLAVAARIRRKRRTERSMETERGPPGSTGRLWRGCLYDGATACRSTWRRFRVLPDLPTGEELQRSYTANRCCTVNRCCRHTLLAVSEKRRPSVYLS